MERFKSLQLLKDMDVTELKTPIIPGYIDKDFLIQKKKILLQINQDNSPASRNKSVRSKSLAVKRKTIKFENENEGMKKRRRTVYKKKTVKI